MFKGSGLESFADQKGHLQHPEAKVPCLVSTGLWTDDLANGTSFEASFAGFAAVLELVVAAGETSSVLALTRYARGA